MTLTEFLLARIAEDEASAHAAAEADGEAWSVRVYNYPAAGATGLVVGPSGDLWDNEDAGSLSMNAPTATHVARLDPARVLAECEAKRRIVEHCIRQAEYIDTPADAVTTIRLLALPYADHPDYRDEWRP